MTKSFLDSCFDPSLDTTDAQVENLADLNLRTGGMSADGRVLSKFLVEGVCLLLVVRATKAGFASDGSKELCVTWEDEVHEGPVWGTLNYSTGVYRTNATKDRVQRRGFGLLGLLASVLPKSGGALSSAWTDFIAKMNEAGDLRPIVGENVEILAVGVEDTLRSLDPFGKNGTSWVMKHDPSEECPVPCESFLKEFITIEGYSQIESDMAVSTAISNTRFQGTALPVLRGLIRRRKHSVLLGPPGIGKTVCAIESLMLEGYKAAGKDFQLFTGHDEVKSVDFLGGWQPTGNPEKPFAWSDGCLVRAMTAHGGKGQPILVEEFTRMPTRAQNMFVSALSDGYVTLNEKLGEIVRAGPDFVLLADMNVDPSADDIELFGVAFASRVRKIEFDYPSVAALEVILKNDVPDSDTTMRSAIISTYTAVMNSWKSQMLPCPVSPRACVQWLEEIVAALADVPASNTGKRSTTAIRDAAKTGASLTWLRDVAGTSFEQRKTVNSHIEASFRMAFKAQAQTTAPETDGASA